MSLFFAAAGGAVVPQIGRDTMRMAVRDIFVIFVFALRFGFDFARVICFVFFHQGLEDVFQSIGGDGGVGIGGSGLRDWCLLDVWVLIFIVCWVLLEDGHVIDELLEFLMN